MTGMYLSTFGRLPTVAEHGACLEFLERQGRLYGGRPDERAAWADLAHALWNVKEFIFHQ